MLNFQLYDQTIRNVLKTQSDGGKGVREARTILNAVQILGGHLEASTREQRLLMVDAALSDAAKFFIDAAHTCDALRTVIGQDK